MAQRDPKQPPPIPPAAAPAAPDQNALIAQLLQQNQQMMQAFGQTQAQMQALMQRGIGAPQQYQQPAPEPPDPVLTAINRVFPEGDADNQPMREMFMAMRQDALAERQRAAKLERDLRQLQASYHGGNITSQTDAAIMAAAAKHGLDPKMLGPLTKQFAANIYAARQNGIEAPIEALADRAVQAAKEFADQVAATERAKAPQKPSPFAVTGGKFPGLARADGEPETVAEMHGTFEEQMAAITRLAGSGEDVNYEELFAAAGESAPEDSPVH